MSTKHVPERMPCISDDEYLCVLGVAKRNCGLRWDDIAVIMNEETHSSYGETYWRKRFKSLMESSECDDKYETNPSYDEDDEESDICERPNSAIEKIKLHDERVALNRSLRTAARTETILELFEKTIKAYDKPYMKAEGHNRKGDRAVYAMLSDLHYGLAFDNYVGRYDSNVARNRVMLYAKEIIRIGEENSANVCYVSLMGDLISGIIHNTIRIENKENFVQQIVEASELISNFLLELSKEFDEVYVNSVDGNHSRFDQDVENTLRGERADYLIFWYCKARLQGLNIHFTQNKYDVTIASFNIYNKTYVAVHGDFEKDLKQSVNKLERIMSNKIDYLLSGHMHVADVTIEDVGYIRNGSVCGSGDDYTMKKRLFGPACQVCLVVDDLGVVSINPILFN